MNPNGSREESVMDLGLLMKYFTPVTSSLTKRDQTLFRKAM